MPTTQTAPTNTLDFDAIYTEAHRDATRIPWADRQPHRALVAWLNAVAPSLVRCGARVAVVGCGLGDDARELVRRGYDVTAFDCSPAAIEWAHEIAPEHAGCFHVADVFDLPGRWRRRFDLVVEINTIQAIDPAVRDAFEAISNLLSPHGHLLVICRGRTSGLLADIDGPPWPLTTEELTAAATAGGLAPVKAIEVFQDAERPPVLRMRGLFRRA